MDAKVEPPNSGKNKRKHDEQVTKRKQKVPTVYTSTTTTTTNTTLAPHQTYTMKNPMCNKCKRKHIDE